MQNITLSGLSEQLVAGNTYTLSSQVSPDTASYNEVTWSIKNSGGTEAVISGNDLEVKNQGTLTLTATVKNGTAYGTAYTQDFTFEVISKVSTIFDETEIPAISGTYGQPLSDMTLSETTDTSKNGIAGTWSITEADCDNIYPTVDGTVDYQITFTPSDREYYDLFITTVVPKVSYLSTDETATLSGTQGNNGWYLGDVTVSAPEGYTIAAANTDPTNGWAESLSAEVTADGEQTVTYYLKETSTGGITDKMQITVKKDAEAPTATITVGTNYWHTFLNTITFGYFFKDTQSVTITGTDETAGVESIQYLLYDAASVEDYNIANASDLEKLAEEKGGWVTGTSFNIEPDHKYIIFAKVTDKAGNVTYVSSEGLVLDNVAPDIVLTPSGTEYNGPSQGDNVYDGSVTITVTADDTAVDTITYKLDHGADAAISNHGTVTIDTAGSHTITVTATDKAGNEKTEILTVTVYKEAPAVTMTGQTVTYDGYEIVAGEDFTISTDGNNGTITYYYKVSSEADAAYQQGLPTDAGTYTVKAEIGEDSENCYKATSQSCTVEITEATPAITLTAVPSGEGDNRTLTITATVAKVGNGTVPSGTVTFYDMTNASDNSGTMLGTEAVALSADGKAEYTWTGLKEQVYQIKAVYNGGGNYNETTSDTISVDTTRKSLTDFKICYYETSMTYGDAAFTLSAFCNELDTLTSGVTYTSSDSNVIAINGTTATITGAGTVTITANRAADDTYNAASAQITVTVAKKALTVTADDILNVVKGSTMPPFNFKTDGLVNGDTFTNPTTSTTVNDTNTTGTFVINISGGTLSNSNSYAVTYVSGTMTIVEAVYNITVTNGTAKINGVTVSKASEGQEVTITANDISGKTFTGWNVSAGGAVLANASAKTTTFTMPGNNVSISAGYKDNPSSGQGGNDDSGNDDSGNDDSGDSSSGSSDSSNTDNDNTDNETTPSTPENETKPGTDSADNGNTATEQKPGTTDNRNETPSETEEEYVSAADGEYTAEIISAAATITTEEGTVISVTGAPDGAVTLVVVLIPTSEKEAWEWLAECLRDAGTPVRAYDIYFLDADGNRFNADGAVITMTAPSVDGTLIACSVNTDGIGKVLASAVSAGKITFTTNGSHYYVLAEKAGAAQPDDPENPSTPQPSNPADSSKTGDSSNIWLWMILAFISGGAAIVLFVGSKRRKKQKST